MAYQPSVNEQCGAKNRLGEPCKIFIQPGHVRCRIHGGSHPGALALVKDRLMKLALPAVVRLGQVIEKGEDNTATKAALGVLDRVGAGPKTSLEVTRMDDGLREASDEELAQKAEELVRRLRNQ